MKTFRVILMDLDGTLFDFEASEHESFFKAFSDNGIPVGEHAYRRYHLINQQLWGMLERGEIGLPSLKVERFRRTMDEMKLKGDPAAINRSYVKHLSNSAVLFDGAAEFCQRLSQKYLICMVTNGLKENQYRRLSLSGLERYTHAMVTSEEAGAPKPEARIFQEALFRCRNPKKEECVLIGDSLAADVCGALAFGIGAIWYNPKEIPPPQEKPLLTARTYEEILEFLNA